MARRYCVTAGRGQVESHKMHRSEIRLLAEDPVLLEAALRKSGALNPQTRVRLEKLILVDKGEWKSEMSGGLIKQVRIAE